MVCLEITTQSLWRHSRHFIEPFRVRKSCFIEWLPATHSLLRYLPLLCVQRLRRLLIRWRLIFLTQILLA